MFHESTNDFLTSPWNGFGNTWLFKGVSGKICPELEDLKNIKQESFRSETQLRDQINYIGCRFAKGKHSCMLKLSTAL